MSSPCLGRIVWVAIPDSAGGSSYKEHPAVIVTPTNQIQAGGEVRVVGVSTKTGLAPRDVQVDLPWHKDGSNRTGLTSPCSAVCTWTHSVRLDEVRRYGGIVPGKQLLKIDLLIKKLAAPASPPPAEPPPPTL